MEFISQLCLEVPSKNRFFPPSLAGPWSLDHAEWMALELYTDRKINASYQEASGVRLGSHVHVNKAIGFFFFFFNGPKLSLPHCYSRRSDLCGQTFNKRISLLPTTPWQGI